MSGDYIYNEVQNIVKEYHSRDPFYLADCLGVNVHVDAIGSLKGLYTICDDEPHIILSNQLDEEEQILVVAHEIGHAVLHGGFVTEGNIFTELAFYDMTSKPEIEANTFAANLLVSDDSFISLACEGYTADCIAKMLSVTTDLLEIKISDMKKRGFPINLPA